MESCGKSHNKACRRNESTIMGEPVKGVNGREVEVSEKAPLLPSAASSKKKRFAKRKVQWNDRHGKKLVEVMEFQPSDSSDSEDDGLEDCICNIM